MITRRRSGVLLHPTSLPGRYGIGELGPEARAFADTLRKMGQRLWQVLPLGPTGYGDSPYQSFSTFAGNVQLISFDQLVHDRLLPRAKLRHFPRFPDARVDYGPVILARMEILRWVCGRFDTRASVRRKKAFLEFVEANADWLEDYALFVALKEDHELRPWTTWEAPLRDREPAALTQARRTHRTAIRNVKILQYLFFDQWRRLVEYCHELGIEIIGDIPIFVAHDSADVWAHRDLFYLDAQGQPNVVAGVPPDYFSATGQLWGNPLYRWDVHERTGYDWWVRRLRKIFEVVDIVRIDHFRGFEAYWEIPGWEKTAMNGKWVQGPNHGLFNVLIEKLGRLPIIAEDLGVITPPVEKLRDDFQFPGMRVLQFAFGNDAKAADYRPDSYPPNCIVYTGTHDNDTTAGWFHSQSGQNSTRSHEEIERERRAILEYLRSDGREIHWDLIALSLRSNANTSIAPLQDIMGLGSEARMNVPGVTAGNWQWRFTWDMLTPEMIHRLRQLTRDSNR
jgi:4-alpha-glucanotransferase